MPNDRLLDMYTKQRNAVGRKRGDQQAYMQGLTNSLTGQDTGILDRLKTLYSLWQGPPQEFQHPQTYGPDEFNSTNTPDEYNAEDLRALGDDFQLNQALARARSAPPNVMAGEPPPNRRRFK